MTGIFAPQGMKGVSMAVARRSPLVADGAAGHDAGDGTAGADDEGDDGLTGQANLFEDGSSTTETRDI